MEQINLSQVLEETSRVVMSGNGDAENLVKKYKIYLKENPRFKKEIRNAITILKRIIELQNKLDNKKIGISNLKKRVQIFFLVSLLLFSIYSISAMSNSFSGSVSVEENLTIQAGHVRIISGDLHLDGSLIHDVGNVVFSGGNFSFDNDAFFINNDNDRIGIGTTEPARLLHLQDDNAVIRIDRDTNSPGFILARFPNNNYTTPWKSFIFGVAATGEDNGTFHITDFHTSVSGGGDRRLTIENDGTVDVPGNFVADKIYLQDSGADYIDWQSGDGVFRASGGFDVGGTLFANDINGGAWLGATLDATDYVKTPIISNSDDDTLTVQDNLDVTGLISSDVGLNTSEIYNDAGLLKIQPEAQGFVELFNVADVGNGDSGQEFKVCRRAPEGNDCMRFYFSASRTGLIHSSNKLTLQAQVPFTINSVTDDIIFKVGDNASAKKFYFKDSDGEDIVNIDSNGWLWIDANMGGGLEVNRGTQNNIQTYMDWQYTDLRFGGDKEYNRIGTWINKSFQIVTDSTPRITINKDGEVGIGTTNPSEKLHIYNGNIRIESDSDPTFYFTRTSDNDTFGFLYDTSENDLHIVMRNDGRDPSFLDDIMTFTPSFRVGIKQPDPRVELDVNGNTILDGKLNVTGNTYLDGNLEVTGNIEPLIFDSTTVDKISLYGDRFGDTNMYGFGVEGTSALYAKSYASHRWYINSNADEGASAKMNLNLAGLGLGTSDPKEELHINSTNPQIIFEEYDGGNYEKVWEIGATNEEFLIRTQNDVYSGSQTAFRIGCRSGTSIGCIEFPHGDITISDLSGSGNDYACLDSTGKLFRSNTAC